MNQNLLTAVVFALFFQFSPSFSYSQNPDENKNHLITGRLYALLYYHHPAFRESADEGINTWIEYQNTLLSSVSSDFETELNKLLTALRVPENGIQLRNIDLNVDPMAHEIQWINSSGFSDSTIKRLTWIALNKPSKKHQALKTDRFTIEHHDIFELNLADSSTVMKLGVIHFWAKMDHFFPYKDLLPLPWDSVLTRYGNQIEQLSDREEYYLLVRKMAAHLHDHHINIVKKEWERWEFGFGNYVTFPVKLILDGDRVFIGAFAEAQKGYEIFKGKEVLTLDGTAVSAVLDSLEEVAQISHPDSRRRKLETMLVPTGSARGMVNKTFSMGLSDTTLILNVDTIGYLELKELRGTLAEAMPVDKEISSQLSYINLTKTGGKDFRKAMNKHRSKPALILDLRGYPPGSLGFLIAREFGRKPKPVARFRYPDETYPGHFSTTRKAASFYVANTADIFLLALNMFKGKTMPVLRKPYLGKVILLTDHEAISSAETTAMILQAYVSDLTIVGRPTKGANGVVADFELPYSISGSFSGLDWYYANGDELQTRGIQPDVYVPFSLEDELLGRDTILEKALELMEK